MAGDCRVENGGGLYIGQEDELEEEREEEREEEEWEWRRIARE